MNTELMSAGSNRAALRLMVSLSCLAVAGCEFDWPGTEDEDAVYRYMDSWTVACDCTGTENSSGLVLDNRTATRSFCSEAFPQPIYAHAACGSLAGDLSGYDISYTCRYITTPTPTRDAVSTCPLSVRVDDAGSSSSPLLSSDAASQGYALGWANPMSDFEGVLTSSDALLSIHYLRWRDARPALTGHVHFTGGQCEGGTCEVTLDGLELEVDDFQIGRPWPARDTRVREGLIRNLTRWVGVRLPDGSVEFADADLVITGRINGDLERIVVHAPEPIRGRFERDHDGQSYFLLQGSLRGSDVRIQLDARFLQVGGTPAARVATTTSCTSGTCVHTHSAARSRTFDGRAVTYRWLDSTGRVLSIASTYRSRPETSYPLTLRVEDSTGRFDTVQLWRPVR